MAPDPPQARGLGPQDLILSHFSLLGLEDLERRAAAAGEAGFAGIGLYLGEYRRLRESGHDDAWIAAVLARHGVCLAEIEALVEWCPLTGEGRRLLEDACHLAATFGARHVAVIGPFGGHLADAVRGFRHLCDAAAEVGLVVSLEHLPFTNVDRLATSLAIVEAADRPNGGVCLDSWHHFRGELDWPLLERLPPERIASVQLDDGAAMPSSPDYFLETTRRRRPLGEGEFDLTRFVRTIRRRGWDGPLAVEVLSDELRTQPPEQVARRLWRSAQTFLASA